jgi:hypothetical protein
VLQDDNLLLLLATAYHVQQHCCHTTIAISCFLVIGIGITIE